MSGKALLPNYRDLFLWNYDNNNESLFELQWVFAPGNWGTQNSMPSYLMYNPDIGNGDGWGGDKGATWWMLSKYDGFVVSGDTMRGRTTDQRLHETFMLPGAYYPEITQTIPGGEQKLVYPYNTGGSNFAAVKKYVVGKAKDVGGQAAQQFYPNNTYMMRLAEMYLVYAEAELGDKDSTNDVKALDYFNKVHMRAGLPRWERQLSWNDIFNERLKEFAVESMAWYDLVQLHYYNPQKAYDILNSQDRGLFEIIPDQFPNPTQWTLVKTSWFTERYITATSGNFRIPLPNTELAQAPNLQKPAVEYP